MSISDFLESYAGNACISIIRHHMMTRDTNMRKHFVKKKETDKYKELISFVLVNLNRPDSLKQLYQYAEQLWRNENENNPSSQV